MRLTRLPAKLLQWERVARVAFRSLRRRLHAKYPQFPREAALGESDSVIVELTPAQGFSW
jgi:hypothetical protein